MKLIKCLFLCLLVNQTTIFCQITLPRLISDGMVLQCHKPLKLWGWASANEAISLDFDKKTFKTTADASGKWAIELPPQQAGAAYDLVFKGEKTRSDGSGKEVKVSDVAFGDVWLCSGQSNMVLPRMLSPATKVK